MEDRHSFVPGASDEKAAKANEYYQDSDTNPNTTASSIFGESTPADSRKRRSEATQLRKSVFGKKHNRLDESKVQICCASVCFATSRR